MWPCTTRPDERQTTRVLAHSLSICGWDHTDSHGLSSVGTLGLDDESVWDEIRVHPLAEMRQVVCVSSVERHGKGPGRDAGCAFACGMDEIGGL